MKYSMVIAGLRICETVSWEGIESCCCLTTDWDVDVAGVDIVVVRRMVVNWNRGYSFERLDPLRHHNFHNAKPNLRNRIHNNNTNIHPTSNSAPSKNTSPPTPLCATPSAGPERPGE
jgi:hypothetical protein